MSKIIKPDFFRRTPFEIAESLLGKFLVRKIGNKIIAVKINEIEIYDGFEDLASHASKGKTERNKIMFKEGGYFYIYLVYGMHWMINIVTGKKEYPSAILLRGGEIIKEKTQESIHLDGPGKLSKFLKIDKKFNGKEAKFSANLWFENRGHVTPKNIIEKTPRIGVQYAGPIWSRKKWRFISK